MKEIIKDLIKLGQDVGKLTEEKLDKLASKIKNKSMSKAEAKKLIVNGIRKVVKVQRKLADELEKTIKTKPAKKKKKR